MSDFKFRTDSYPPVVKYLIISNVLVFIAQQLFDSQYNLTALLALYPITTPEFRPYQIITHMFTHSPNRIFHILFNMVSLWMFGKILENLWGAKRFLNFYLLCGIGAAIFHLLIQHYTGNYSAAIGASGAVMGIFIAFGYLFPNTELFLMFIPIPIKAKWVVMGLIAYDLFGGVANSSSDNVAHFAHLGGAITGFIIVLIWNKKNRQRFY